MMVDLEKIPNLFLVGAPKCGTTALSSYLASHPNIFMSEEATNIRSINEIPSTKEPGFYAKDSNDLFAERKVKEKGEYLSIFSQASKSALWLGDASVIYLSSKIAISAILSDSPHARFIVCVRNPVKVAHSMHVHRIKSGTENIIDFEKAWKLQEIRMQGKNLPPRTNKSPLAFQYGRLAKIGSQLKNMLEIVPRERVHIIVQDDMIIDPLKVYKEVLLFLNLEYDGKKDFERINESKKIKNNLYINSLLFVKNIYKKLNLPPLRLGIYSNLYQQGLEPGKPVIRPEFEKELKRYFESEVHILEEILERKFESWVN